MSGARKRNDGQRAAGRAEGLARPARRGSPRIQLVHWKAAEVADRAATLRAAGYAVEAMPLGTPAALRELAARPPRW